MADLPDLVAGCSGCGKWRARRMGLWMLPKMSALPVRGNFWIAVILWSIKLLAISNRNNETGECL